MDARQGQPSVVRGDATGDVDTPIAVSKTNIINLLDGNLDAMLATGLGRIKVRGSKGVATRLGFC